MVAPETDLKNNCPLRSKSGVSPVHGVLSHITTGHYTIHNMKPFKGRNETGNFFHLKLFEKTNKITIRLKSAMKNHLQRVQKWVPK